MPEATEDAVFLIATSFQALERAKAGYEETMICNCTVVLVFAAFFIEANLSHIIVEIGESKAMNKSLDTKSPGLYPKLTWFYNEHIRQDKEEDTNKLFSPEFRRELYDYFDGLEEIHSFRNDVAHGKLNRSLTNLIDAKRLRESAKNIVKRLFEIAEGEGHKIPRAITYQMAISSEPDSEED